MGLREYIIRRVIISFITIFVVSAIIFFVMRLIPGDPLLIWIGFEEYDPLLYDILLKKFGLDKPLIVQYGNWLWGALHGDLGNSILVQRPVLPDLLRRLPISIELIGLSLVIALCVSVPSGIISAVKRDTKTDYAARIFALTGISLPEFFIGVLLILIFAIYLRVLPPSGYVNFFSDPLQNLKYMLLPAIALGYPRAAVLSRLIRSSMLEVLQADYVRTARSKGLVERLVIYKHALKNALIPPVTMLGLQVGYLIGGSIIVEIIFAIPGIGSFGMASLLNRDYPRVQGFILVASTVFILASLIVDIIYAYLDPRIKY